MWAKKCNKLPGQAFITAPFTDLFPRRSFPFFRYKAAYHVCALCFFAVSKLNRGKIALATFTILAGSQVEEAQQRGGGVTIKVARVESTEDLGEW